MSSAAQGRCGRITDPGSTYPHPCVLPEGHDGECDPRPPETRSAAQERDYSPEFRDWLTRGSPGSVQRERYERAVRAWNRGASEAEVAEIMGLTLPKETT